LTLCQFFVHLNDFLHPVQKKLFDLFHKVLVVQQFKADVESRELGEVDKVEMLLRQLDKKMEWKNCNEVQCEPTFQVNHKNFPEVSLHLI